MSPFHAIHSAATTGRRHLPFLMAGLLLAGCAVNPVTGKRELSLVSEAQEIDIGRTEAGNVVRQLGLHPDTAVQGYVSRIGLRMAAISERPGLPWSFQVVEDASVNAFALPGGFIFVTRGILTHLNSEAELAAVVGHEIGHVTAKHTVQSISRAQVAQIGLGVGSIISPTVQSLGGLASTGLGVLFLKYGRDAEEQSDALGFRYALREGYDVRAMSDVFRTLQGVSENAGVGRTPQWLSTHPDPENRVGKNEDRLAALTTSVEGTVLNRTTYLRRIEGMVFGEDPRQGYFENGTFYHPDLRFQLTFPQGWQTQNQPDAVAGGGPNGDVIVVLELVREANTPDEGLRAFSAEQGVTATGQSSISANGLDGVQTRFRVATQQGTLEGEAAFFEHRNVVYRILGYGTQSGFRNNANAVRNTLRSFAPVTDPAVLNRQPMRITLVLLPRDMTVAEFRQAYPSSIPIEQLALINGVSVDGRFARGTLVKRVR